MFIYLNAWSQSYIVQRMRGKNQKSYREAQYVCAEEWSCDRLLDRGCPDLHDPEDKANAISLRRLLKNNPKGEIILVADTYSKDNTPICLLEPFLPIQVCSLGDTKIEPGLYYVGTYVETRRRKAIIRYERVLGEFGDWKSEEFIYERFCPEEYFLSKPQDRVYEGEIIVNDKYIKILIGDRGKRYNLEPVNRPEKYPLLKGTKVSYFQERGKAQITRIKYPHRIQLCGILQIDKNSQFYFKSRNQSYDDMSPYFIPGDISKSLQNWKYLFPYSMLKEQKLRQDKQDEVNKILKDLLVKGEFKAWPSHCAYPIIDLLDEVVERNFKNLKSGIIYESGIVAQNFSEYEKGEAVRIAKKFDIQNYKKRTAIRTGIVTVDSRQTKCHDDAIYIKQRQDKSYVVQIHIADVAELVKSKTKLDEEVRLRDKAIYIKNYYQPMFPEKVRNIMSLKEDSDKLAFTLAFQVTSEGFVDFRKVSFFKSIINVEKNLAHQRLERGDEAFPELFKLNNVIQHSRLVDSNYILQCQSKSEIAMTKLIYLSAIIPTFMLQANIKRSKLLKDETSEYIKKMIEAKKADMERWQTEITKINDMSKQAMKNKGQLEQIERKISRQIQRQRNRIRKLLKDEEKKDKAAKKQRVKKQKEQRLKQKRVDSKQDSQQQQQTESQEQNQGESQQKQMSQTQFGADLLSKKDVSQKLDIQIEQIDDQKQKVQKQKRAKAIKDLQEFSSQSQSSSSSSDDDLDGDFNAETSKMNKAVGGKFYLERVFKLPIFNIDIKWRDQQEIKDAFKFILSKDKGRLYQEYFKRMQILNRQHFKYIVKMERDKRRQEGQVKKDTESESIASKSTKVDRQRNERRNYKQKNQDTREDKKNTEIKEDNKQQKQNKREKKQQKKIQNVKKQQQKMPNEQIIVNKAEQKKPKPKYRQVTKKQQINQNLPKQQKKQEAIKEVIKTREQQIVNKSESIKLEKQQKQQKHQKLEIKQQQKINPTQNLKQQKKPRQPKERRQKKQPKNQNLKNEKEGLKFGTRQQKYKQLDGLNEAEKDRFQQKKQSIKKRVSENQDRLVQKYRLPFSNKEKFELSEDQDIQNEENVQLRALLKDIKSYAIFILMKKNFRYQNRMKKGNSNKQEDNIQNEIKDQNQEQISSPRNNKQKGRNARNKKQKQIKPSGEPQKKEKCEHQQSQITKIQHIKQQALQKTESQEKIQVRQKKQEVFIKVQQSASAIVEQTQVHVPTLIEKKSIKKALSKRQMDRKVQELLKPSANQIKLKYAEQKQKLATNFKQLDKQMKDSKVSFKQQLQKAEKQYNLIRFLAVQQKQEEVPQVNKKQKKNAKGNKKNKSKKKDAYNDFLDNFQYYAKKANFKFNKLDHEEIDQFLQKQFNIRQICTQSQIQSTNRLASKLGGDEKSLLKWNNPIRSYESLRVMRLIKNYSWLFQGKIHPTDVILYHQDIKDIQRELKDLVKYRQQKIQRGETDKRAKEANRQIAKLQFYNLIKRGDNSVQTFLTITSPPSLPVRRVYHSVLQEIDVKFNKKYENNYPLFKQVKGNVIVVSDFPIQFRVELQ